MNYEDILKRYSERVKLSVEDMIDIVNSVNAANDQGIIQFVYTDDEYGEAARELHKARKLGPTYPGDAGIDLPIVLSVEDRKHGKKVIWPGEREMLHTGIIMEFPPGYFGRIVHRSSTEKVFRLRVVEGIIDNGFRGPLKSHVYNGNTCQAEVYHGDRLAQLILAKTASFQCTEVDKLNPSSRDVSGWGSSGR